MTDVAKETSRELDRYARSPLLVSLALSSMYGLLDLISVGQVWPVGADSAFCQVSPCLSVFCQLYQLCD